MADKSLTYQFNSNLYMQEGYLYCEEIRFVDLQKALKKTLSQPSPLFVYSKAQLRENVDAYKDTLKSSGIPHILGYSLKANHNPSLVQLLASWGCAAITVSGHEITLALEQGIDAGSIIFNGNGKMKWELEVAVRNGCLINVDSEFDLQHILQACRLTSCRAKILLRINPDIDPKVHPFLATGLAKSKFGLDPEHLEKVLLSLKDQTEVDLVGLHCHLGSTIDTIKVFSESVEVMLSYVEYIKKQGFTKLKYMNLGGGLGIDYNAHAFRTVVNPTKPLNSDTNRKVPRPQELIKAVQAQLVASGLTLILEPGRSLVGSAVTFLTTVIGVKHNGDKRYLVVDGAMSEVIRPSLYDAYHHIELAEPSTALLPTQAVYDVVGPVCECADFLGKERLLITPHEGCILAVFDAGAYCSSMACNYNMRMRPAEILVDGSSWKVIRQPDSIQDVLKPYIHVQPQE